MLFAFREDCQCAPNSVGGEPPLCLRVFLYLGVYNSRGYFGVTQFTSPRDACERCRFGAPGKPAYCDPKGRNDRLSVPTTGKQDPRVARRPVARRAHALVQRSAESAKGESGARMRPENSRRETLWTR